MKTLLASLSVVILAGCSAYADPVGQRTPNGGFEYYSNYHEGKGTVKDGCILPWRAAGFPTLGYNPKHVIYGEPSEFFDCKIEAEKKVVVKEKETVVVVPVAPAKPVEPPAAAPAPVPAPMPAPAPAATPKPVKE